jgi:hypothetical protein
MSRTIVARKIVPPDTYTGTKELPPRPDDYATRLLKYIPAEVITLYLTLTSLLRSSVDASPILDWVIFAIGTVATPLYLWRLQKVHRILQLAISTGAFIVWAFALGGPFTGVSWYVPVYGGILLSVYTFLIPILEA